MKFEFSSIDDIVYELQTSVEDNSESLRLIRKFNNKVLSRKEDMSNIPDDVLIITTPTSNKKLIEIISSFKWKDIISIERNDDGSVDLPWMERRARFNTINSTWFDINEFISMSV